MLRRRTEEKLTSYCVGRRRMQIADDVCGLMRDRRSLFLFLAARSSYLDTTDASVMLLLLMMLVADKTCCATMLLLINTRFTTTRTNCSAAAAAVE